MDLFYNFSLFKDLPEKIKLNMLKVSCHNDFRYLRSSNTKQKEALGQILRAESLGDIVIFKKILETIDKKLDSSDWGNANYLNKILGASRILEATNLDKWESGVALNIWLANKNYCPLLHFAFDEWHDTTRNQSTIGALIELSTTYLYRIALLNDAVTTNGIEIANGSHNSIFLISQKEIIEKIPKSIAAKYFINDQEVETTKILSRTELKEHMAHIISYDENTKKITRQYIAGKTGHELLATKFFKENQEAINQLEKFYNIYKKVREDTGINLDIHPGNFVWSNKKEDWILIDTGPIPLIGSEYFPLNSFEKYFNKIWVERYERIKNLPVRSVDLML